MLDSLAERIERLERQIAEEEAHLRQLVTRGVPNQNAEDHLRRLLKELARLRQVPSRQA
jgi:hypothetical protein